MVRIDKNQEGIAYIRMSVDTSDQIRRRTEASSDETDGAPQPNTMKVQGHWAIGSQKRKVQLSKYQEMHKDNLAFTHFTTKLLQFLDDALPADSVMTLPFEVTIFSLHVDIILFTYIPGYTYQNYTSLEDW